MFFFVSEPVLDLGGSGTASFAVGVATIRCASMPEAIGLSRRLRAVLHALLRRGGRPRARPRGLTSAEALDRWIDDLELVVSLPTGPGSLYPSDPASDTRAPAPRDEFEAPS